MRTRFALPAVSFLLLGLHVAAAQPESPRNLDAVEVRLALKKLTVLGSVLYIGAHPDDENTAFLASMAKGRLMRTAYLSITRGEGGQNLLGSEQGDLMGIIRTQELLAARRIDGAEQFFTRAIDFGYSKTLEESMRIWGKERTLSDVVWIVRSFRPDVIVTRFTPTQGGHGNHTSSAQLAEEAFAAAADPQRYPEQLKFVKPWKPKRLLWNAFRFQQSDRAAAPENSVSIDLGAYSPLLGESFTEIAGRSRSMHKSQGFGASQSRGEFVNYFQNTAGDPATKDLFDGVNTTWSRISGGEKVGQLLEEASRSFDENDPARVIPVLANAYAQLKTLKDDPWIRVKRQEIIDAMKLCGGLWLDALSSENFVTPGNVVGITVTALNRSQYPFALKRVRGSLGRIDTTLDAPLRNNLQVQLTFGPRIPAETPYTQPYWLVKKPDLGAYEISNQEDVGRPENPPELVVTLTISAGQVDFDVEVPVRYRAVDPVEGEQYRPLSIVPPVAVSLPEKVYIFPDGEKKSIQVNVRASTTKISGTLALQVPKGWTVSPSTIPFDLGQKDETASLSFLVQPGSAAESGLFGAVAGVGDRQVDQDIVSIRYPHIPMQTVFPKAEGRVLRLDLKTTKKRIGYIMGSGDDIPVALKQLGYPVTLLTDDDLKNGVLSGYDVIIAGVRSYNTRPALRASQHNLMAYVEQGGTYVVQYMTARRTESENLGPYPFNVSSDRVSVEDAPVRFLSPDNPILNFPNKITQTDFEGWIQERGLYFADKWDPRYTAVLASNDPGEPSRDGGLLVSSYGKGFYVFTGYAFFRQLPAGVPGAYRLFVNIISVGK